jgi:hypothetical protein
MMHQGAENFNDIRDMKIEPKQRLTKKDLQGENMNICLAFVRRNYGM